jgi:signal transduction histidine kinase
VQDRLATDNIHLDVAVADASAPFIADERRVVQVLYNLLANAVGFSPPGGTVAVTATQRDSRTIFAVADQGPGIAPESQGKVFDWFESNANGSRHRGAGLGLSLVRSFVEMHGGKVTIDSAVGRGTTVICEFPVSPPVRTAE